MNSYKCTNLCANYCNEVTCKYCKENYEVSKSWCIAKRELDSAGYVVGYLVQDKNGVCKGILNKDSDYQELAFIDSDTVEPYNEHKHKELMEKAGKLEYVPFCGETTQSAKVRKFDIPSFEDWYDTDKMYDEFIGPYMCAIWVEGPLSEQRNCLALRVLDADSEVGTKDLFIDSITCDYHAKNKREVIKDWYEKATKELNKFWVGYVSGLFLE